MQIGLCDLPYAICPMQISGRKFFAWKASPPTSQAWSARVSSYRGRVLKAEKFPAREAQKQDKP
ncbi:hypothetical protein O77CONTIG1_03983 [Leptolyngbya sp. O-77]|nr:hypothetical protein O77CONTIG1_03983 [Leptolyngbya sp. O-77]